MVTVGADRYPEPGFTTGTLTITPAEITAAPATAATAVLPEGSLNTMVGGVDELYPEPPLITVTPMTLYKA